MQEIAVSVQNQSIKAELLSLSFKKKEEAACFAYLAFWLLRPKNKQASSKLFVLDYKKIEFLDYLYEILQRFLEYPFYLDVETGRLFCEEKASIQKLKKHVRYVSAVLENACPLSKEQEEEIDKNLQEFLQSTKQISLLQSLFVRLCFYFWGSFSYTSKNKKLEIRFPLEHQEIFSLVQKIFALWKMEVFVVEAQRKIYFQKNASLSTFFAHLKLTKTLLALEDHWALQSLNQQVQRSLNFDDANLKRQVKASEQMLEVFWKHLEQATFSSLSLEEQKMVLLRLQYPEHSLQELTQFTEPRKSKAQLHYALNKIKKKLEGEA